MPFIFLPVISSDDTVHTQPIQAGNPWLVERLKHAFARMWAFILHMATSFVGWFESTYLGHKIIEIFSAIDSFTQAHPFLIGIPLVLYYGPNLLRVLVTIPWFTFRLLLHSLGFGREGVQRDSLAASYESRYYTYGTGGIPHDSLFAHMQSAGARTPSWRTSFTICVWYALDLTLGVWGFYILGRYYGLVQ